MRLDKAKDCSIQKYLEASSEYSALVQLETRSRERIVVLPDKVACNRPLRTLPAVCMEKVVCMKTKDELHQKVRLTPRVPQVVLKKTRNLDYKINNNRTQEHLVTNQADQNCPGNPGATPWITEFPVSFFLQLNCKIHIASRTTRTKNPSFRTSSRRRRSTSSARNRRISSLP